MEISGKVIDSIVIVDYGVGNVGAVANMMDYLGVDTCITASPEMILSAKKIILPGVGAFDRAMGLLQQKNLIEVLNQAVIQHRIPVLGVCLGMQLLAERSEEGKLPGLGWISGEVVRLQISAETSLKIPHMGWSEIQVKRESPLFDGMVKKRRFYFDHSYHLVCRDEQDVVSVIDYGGEVTCAVNRENVFGVQFHPEKSHKFGLELLGRFASLRM